MLLFHVVIKASEQCLYSSSSLTKYYWWVVTRNTSRFSRNSKTFAIEFLWSVHFLVFDNLVNTICSYTWEFQVLLSRSSCICKANNYLIWLLVFNELKPKAVLSEINTHYTPLVKWTKILIGVTWMTYIYIKMKYEARFQFNMKYAEFFVRNNRCLFVMTFWIAMKKKFMSKKIVLKYVLFIQVLSRVYIVLSTLNSLHTASY